MTVAPLASPGAAAAVDPPAVAAGTDRFAMLDGWRAASILLVLAGHLLPLGPKRFQLNATAAATGMALFFTLSGFLIVRFLSERTDLRVFLIRRFFRIVPLAWVATLVLMVAYRAPPETWAANFLFYANLPPQHLVNGGAHLWSLCVEVQFYVAAGVFAALMGGRALAWGVPLAALAVTAHRVWVGSPIDIVTWRRVDEILAGGILALLYAGRYGDAPRRLVALAHPYLLFPLLLLSAHPQGGAIAYLRPYLAALTVGSTLFTAPVLLRRLFENRVAAYIATISYALYVIHGVLGATWLASGDTLVKYAKRPLLFVITFGLAHLSTFRFEQPMIGVAKRLTAGRPIRLPA